MERYRGQFFFYYQSVQHSPPLPYNFLASLSASFIVSSSQQSSRDPAPSPSPSSASSSSGSDFGSSSGFGSGPAPSGLFFWVSLPQPSRVSSGSSGSLSLLYATSRFNPFPLSFVFPLVLCFCCFYAYFVLYSSFICDSVNLSLPKFTYLTF